MISLEPELEKTLETIAKQERITPNEIIKRLLNQYLTQQQDSGYLAEIAETLPKLACFKNKDPLAIQQAMRDEWH
jgi:predicted transcriptional regulator